MWLIHCYRVLAVASTMVRAPSPPLAPPHGEATCAKGSLDSTLQLACPVGGVITGVNFAQYGLITGSCPSSLTKQGSCDVDISQPVESACVGQGSCTVMCSHSCCPSPRCCGCLLTSGSNKTTVHFSIPDPLPGATKVSAVRVSCNNTQRLPEKDTSFTVDQPVNTKTNISYFSWYSYTGCAEGLLPEPGCLRNLSASPDATLRNLAMDGDLSFLRRTHSQLSVPSMLYLQNSKWHKGVYDYSPAETGLAAGWEQAIDDCIATLVPLAKGNGGHIHGVQLGDELVCGSIKHFSFANLSALAGRLHDGLHPHGVFVFTNECAGTPAAWPEIPSGLDVLSVDVYVAGACEAASAKLHYEHFLSKLQLHQSVWLVPGLFGSNSTARDATTPNATAMLENDESLVEKLSAYWAWAEEEPRITGFIPWHWGNLGLGYVANPANPPKFQLGADSFPKTLAWIAGKVAMLAPLPEL